ncbi:hypothetical protein DAEQUDRAFT_726233 [Daedalea quercina L-15889]|uniref:Mitochondrial K+-H+ exchange-related-domain-containing protein n=1 Tax=Daedalea quercina L-15889 TaxID=1314783 RepID=A0A165QLD8_9APHY|nr:hypothetical protein DAEQUDRAFT_726233 [Daedalea quercina L-15889]
MSVIPSAKSAVRIVALPLTRPSAVTTGRLAEHLTYYHIVTPPPSEGQKRNWARRMENKAADLWAGLGKAPEGNWRRKAFLYGERLVDRLEFEELALKSFDTSLGPKILPGQRKDKLELMSAHKIPLLYPPSVCKSPLAHLRALLAVRTPQHRKGALMWTAISPLTAPLKLIPIIPNFPFFFCAWRAWSHYGAYKASQYLQSCVEHEAIVPQASSELDTIYMEHAPAAPEGESRSPETVHQQLLLEHTAVPALEKLLGFPPGGSFAADVYRALEQARLRLEGAAW